MCIEREPETDLNSYNKVNHIKGSQGLSGGVKPSGMLNFFHYSRIIKVFSHQKNLESCFSLFYQNAFEIIFIGILP